MIFSYLSFAQVAHCYTNVKKTLCQTLLNGNHVSSICVMVISNISKEAPGFSNY